MPRKRPEGKVDRPDLPRGARRMRWTFPLLTSFIQAVRVTPHPPLRGTFPSKGKAKGIAFSCPKVTKCSEKSFGFKSDLSIMNHAAPSADGCATKLFYF